MHTSKFEKNVQKTRRAMFSIFGFPEVRRYARLILLMPMLYVLG